MRVAIDSKAALAGYREGDRIPCLICGKMFRRVAGQHLKSHHITDDEYRQRFGIPFGVGICSTALSEKLAAAHDADRRAKASATMKAQRQNRSGSRPVKSPAWIREDPSYRAKLSASLKRALADPEVRGRRTKALVEALAMPASVQKRSAAQKARCTDPAWRAYISERQKARFADPAVRLRLAAAVKAGIANRRAKNSGDA